jgi:hypothetical protein
MNYHVIVAKYKEDISWLEEMDKSHIYLYDKGSTENNPIQGFAHYEQRPNIGRESETYLYHIIKHYDNLPEFLILLQGDPFDHFRNFSTKIEPIQLQKLIEKSINDKLLETFPIFSGYANEPTNTFPGLKVSEYYSYIFQGSIQSAIFSGGCQYYVHKSKILSKPKAFWEKIYKMLVNVTFYEGVEVTMITSHEKDIPFNKSCMNPWIFERLAGYFFNDIPMNNPLFLEN